MERFLINVRDWDAIRRGKWNVQLCVPDKVEYSIDAVNAAEKVLPRRATFTEKHGCLLLVLRELKYDDRQCSYHLSPLTDVSLQNPE